MICKVDKNPFFCNMEISHYVSLQTVQYFNWINTSLKYDHRFSECLLYLFLLAEWISKFILGKVQKCHWSIHGTYQDTESIKGPEENKGPSLFSISFIDAKGQYNKLLNKHLSIRLLSQRLLMEPKKWDSKETGWWTAGVRVPIFLWRLHTGRWH